MTQWLKYSGFCIGSAVLAHLALADVAVAGPAGPLAVQGQVLDDGDDGRRGRDQDGAMDDEPDSRSRAPDRDDPSEDGTASPPDDSETPPGCIFQERALELFV